MSSLSNQILNIVHNNSQHYRIIVYWLYVFVLLFFAIKLYLLGPIVHLRFGHDVPYLTDGAWRLFNGHVPYRDFHSPTIGPLIFLLLSFFMKYTEFSIQSFVCLQIASLFVFSFWSYYISRSFLSSSLSVITSFSVTIFVLGVYHLGVDDAVTYANLYNRYGFALLCLVVIECFFITKGDAVASFNKFYGYSTGIALALLLFNKITFFIAGLAVFWLSLVFNRNKILFFRSVSSLLVTLFLGWLSFRISLSDMISDMFVPLMVKLTQQHDYSFVIGFSINWVVIIVSLMLVFLFVRYARCDSDISIQSEWLILVVLAYFFLSAFLYATNYGKSDMPLLSLLPVNILAILYSNDHSRPNPRLKMIAIVLLFILSAPFWFKNLYSDWLAFSVADIRPYLEKIDSQFFSDFFVLNADGYWNEKYIEKLNDGISLLREKIGPSDRIISLSFENPFSLALGLSPPKHDLLVWHYGMTFNEAIHYEADDIFRDCTHIIYPRSGDPESTTPLLKIYGDFIYNNFTKIAESKYWILLKKL